MRNPLIIPTAEPFILPGGKTGILLIHGFTGSPKELRWWAEDLNQRGYTVLAPRLAGHATQPEDMLRECWWDWLASVEDGYNLLKGITDQQLVMGLSLGGALSLMAASRYPFKGVVAMSAPYELHDSPLLPYARILSYLSPRQPKGKPDWRNPEAAIDHVEYPFFPTRSIADLVDFLSAMRSCLPEVKIPALLVHSRSDEGVPPENALQNFEHLGSADKEIFWVENSGHVICKEPERQRAFDAIGAFIERILSKPK